MATSAQRLKHDKSVSGEYRLVAAIIFQAELDARRAGRAGQEAREFLADIRRRNRGARHGKGEI